MNRKLSRRDYVAIASMLFGLFFGAGNLIFPVYMGQMAGRNFAPAAIGFLITGVGLPLLGIVAMGISRSNGLLEMAGRVSKRYSMIFTIALYLTIGPFFAIPRTATVPFSVGIEPLVSNSVHMQTLLAIFSLFFFAAVLFFSLRPSKILTWVGKILNPLFLILLGVLVIAALIHPMGACASVAPSGVYAEESFFNGFMEGYNTMDALASLAFGIVVINVIKRLGVQDPGAIAADTVLSGCFSMMIMGIVYIALIVLGAESRVIMPASSNGGVALAKIAEHYFGNAGAVLLACMITLACLKTAVGLVTSCGETFQTITKGKIKYPVYAVAFCVISFCIANLGLTKIIAYSIPVLMLLYPLVMTLILLSLFGKFFGYARSVFASVTVMTFIASLFDFVNALPAGVKESIHANVVTGFAQRWLPLFKLGLGWIVPAAVGFAVGLIYKCIKDRRAVTVNNN